MPEVTRLFRPDSPVLILLRDEGLLHRLTAETLELIALSW